MTEHFVREHFAGIEGILVEEQMSQNNAITSLLNKASKAGTGNAGRPEFIIQFDATSEFLIVIECKAKITDHKGEIHNPQKFAVDGAKWYSQFLSEKYDVLAIAVSGMSLSKCCVSSFLQFRGGNCKSINQEVLLTADDYLRIYQNHPEKYRADYDSLREYMKNLNRDLHKHGIPENKRATLISMMLVSLKSGSFRAGYKREESPKQLVNFLVDTAISELEKGGVHGQKKREMLDSEFSFLKTNNVLPKEKHILRNIIVDVDKKVNSFAETHEYRDVLGDMYIEFLRYANSDKGLGIVLTPPHITGLFIKLANLTPRSVVYDNCAGTGGFLVAAMREMIVRAKGDSKLESRIKEEGVIGTDMQPHIFTLAVSNMFIHQDGKSKIRSESCFDPELIKWVKEQKPTAGFLNPPYGNACNQDELEFILNNLECLTEGSTCIALIPMQCALATGGERLVFKEQLLAKHTLEAVLSMPDDLFLNAKVSTVTCAMIFTAHKPHPKVKDVFLGYFKDDGFERRRIGGRCDAFGKWESIQSRWIDLFQSRREAPGLSVCAPLTAKDEWAAELFVKTDYSKIVKSDFENEIHQYSTYLYSNGILKSADSAPAKCMDISLDTSNFNPVSVMSLFEIDGTPTTKPDDIRIMELESSKELLPYLTTQSTNNGVQGYFTPDFRIIAPISIGSSSHLIMLRCCCRNSI